MTEDGVLQNFHLKPGRVALQLTKPVARLTSLFRANKFYQFGNKKILLIDTAMNFEIPTHKLDIDILVLSHNPKINLARMTQVFNFRLIIFDASNSLWKIDKWRKECEELHLRSYSVPEKGAFVLDLQ